MLTFDLLFLIAEEFPNKKNIWTFLSFPHCHCDYLYLLCLVVPCAVYVLATKEYSWFIHGRLLLHDALVSNLCYNYFIYSFLVCVHSRHLMLLTGSKLDEQIPQAHWGSSLIMVIFLHCVFHSIVFHYAYLFVINEDVFNCICRVWRTCLHSMSLIALAIIFKSLKDNKDTLLWYFQFEALAFGSTAMCGRNTFWWWLISAITFYGATWEQ